MIFAKENFAKNINKTWDLYNIDLNNLHAEIPRLPCTIQNWTNINETLNKVKTVLYFQHILSDNYGHRLHRLRAACEAYITRCTTELLIHTENQNENNPTDIKDDDFEPEQPGKQHPPKPKDNKRPKKPKSRELCDDGIEPILSQVVWNKQTQKWECWYRACGMDIDIRLPKIPPINPIPPIIISIPDLEQGNYDCKNNIVLISYRTDPEGRAWLRSKGTDPDDYDEKTLKMGCITTIPIRETLTEQQKYKIRVVHQLFSAFPEKYITHSIKNYLLFWPSRLDKVYDYYTIYTQRKRMLSHFYFYYNGYLRWDIDQMDFKWPIFRMRTVKTNVKPPNDYPMRKLYVRYWEYLEGNLPLR